MGKRQEKGVLLGGTPQPLPINEAGPGYCSMTLGCAGKSNKQGRQKKGGTEQTTAMVNHNNTFRWERKKSQVRKVVESIFTPQN